MAPLFVAAAFLAALAALLLPPWLARRRRERVRARAFPPAWESILRRNVPLGLRLPPPLARRWRADILQFVDEKAFHGCAGQEIDDEVRVTVAAQACLVTLGRRQGLYERLRDVLVYPGAFVVERVRPEPSGVLQEHREALSGESWSRGQVVLSWADAIEGGRIPDDGRNVVIHEFAHQLDQEKGYANGAPWLAGRERRDRWSGVMARAYARLQHEAALGIPGVLSGYGATAPEEFFAVASEAFFEQPAALAAAFPDLYDELAAFFALDPRAW